MKITVKQMVLGALLLALGIVLPLAFHAIPNAGSILSPMHIPVLIAGLACGWPVGLIVGALTPLLSSVLTGMPPMAYAPSMICELAVYGLISGLLMQLIRTGKTTWDVILSLVCAMLAGRVVYGVLNALIFRAGAYSMEMWVTSAFVNAVPAIVVQLLAVPGIVLALEREKLVEKRY